MSIGRTKRLGFANHFTVRNWKGLSLGRKPFPRGERSCCNRSCSISRRFRWDRFRDGIVFEAANKLLGALRRVGIHANLQPSDKVAWLHPGIQIGIWQGETQIGVVGRALKVAYGEIWIEALSFSERVLFSSLPQYPSTSRDVAFDLDRDISASLVIEDLYDIFEIIAPHSTILLGSSASVFSTSAIEVIEEYRGKGIQDGRRSLLLRLHYRSSERSLTDLEVQQVHDQLIQKTLAILRTNDPLARIR